jgi:hypothetical protein
VVDNLIKVNESLNKITEGDLDEKVSVYNSSEFASLSDDINLTVDALKGYIEAAEKRIEQELMLARTIQASALPTNFDFNNDAFELYATMDPAKEVGGDFYDFFSVDSDRMALVMADVSGKGIPASLFMMRSKTTIRGLVERGLGPAAVLERVNNVLCAGNEASMFVTVWIGILDLRTGKVSAANAEPKNPASVMATCIVDKNFDESFVSFWSLRALFLVFLSPSSTIFSIFAEFIDKKAVSALANIAFNAMRNT